MSAHVANVPLNTIKAPQKINARTFTDDDLGILAASIEHKGLIQPLAVRSIGNGQFEVIDGRRRHAALNALVKAKKILKDEPVPVIVRQESDVDALETSLAANIVRLPMHPVDQFEVFARIEAEGISVEEIAARFGISELQVRQHLALGRLAEPIRAALRADQIDMPVAKLFTTEPIENQLAIWAALIQVNNSPSPYQVRRMLEEARVLIANIPPLVLAEYERRGGEILRSLFDDNGYATDPALIEVARQTVADQMAARFLKAGWKWAIPEGSSAQKWTSAPQPDPVFTPKETARLAKMSKRLEAIEAQLFGDQSEAEADTDALWEEQERLEDERDRIENEATARAYTPEQRAGLGVVFSIDNPGRAKYGCVAKGDAAGSQPIDGGNVDTSLPSLDREDISAALLADTTADLSQALAMAVAESPAIAARVLLVALECGSYRGIAKISPTRLAAVSQAVGVSQMIDGDAVATWRETGKMTATQIASRLAVAVASTIDVILNNPASEASPIQGGVIEALTPRAWTKHAVASFRPLDYFSRSSRTTIADALAEMGHEGAGPKKKADAAKLAAELAASTGWLPTDWRHPEFKLKTGRR